MYVGEFSPESGLMRDLRRCLPRVALVVAAAAASTACVTRPHVDDRVLEVIAFGSCVHQDHPQPIWAAINAERADLFVFLGDNVYGDTEDMSVLRAQYRKLADNRGFRELARTTPLVATWDDHDFGMNDAGADYPMKAESRQIMLDFFGEPAESARRHREDGIYTSYRFGPSGRRVQLILLDLRWNRSPLQRADEATIAGEREPAGMGPYVPVAGPDAVLLGEAQWRWLERELERPADVRIIASSLQLLTEFNGWESWANFPAERERLFALLRRLGTEGVFIVSGDSHWAELSRLDGALDYPLWDLTSSGLTEEWHRVSPNPRRQGEAYAGANYGLMEIDWQLPDPAITLTIRDVHGNVVISHRLRLGDLG